VRRRRVATILALGLLVTACGTIQSTPSASSVAASATPSQPPTMLGTPVPADDSVAVDASLLDVLPTSAADVERRDDPETAADIAASDGLAADIDAVAVALYIADDDYAVATVVRPQEGVVDDAWFRDWRDTFDAGVCEQAGGVETGRSEIKIDERTVHRSTCVGGVVIHHVYVPGAERLISIQGAGSADLGRSILDDLTE
jgi:hypothetical protein